MKTLTIKSKKGTFDFVYSDEDDDLVNGRTWSVSFFRNGNPRAESGAGKSRVRLHRLLMGVSNPTIIVDHIDGDTLNNQRENLRICSNAENLRNRGKTKANTSGIKGVTWDKRRKKWIAQIKVNYKGICIGAFETKEAAGEAYEKAARQYHGEFAKT